MRVRRTRNTARARLGARGLCLVALALGPLACDESSGPEWTLVHTDLEGALLSVWGTAADDVWAVGSDPGDGPYILHFDGSAWSRVETSATGDLWWVTSGPAGTWMSGENGLVLRHDPGSGTAIPEDVGGTTFTLFGIYGFAADDVWAVGGDPVNQGGVVLHFDGSGWTEMPIPAEAANVSFFKAWGERPDDVWIVGHGGTALHWDGQGLAPVPVPQGRPLFTVHGSGEDVVAVGGFGSGILLQVENGTLADRTPPMAPQLNGVFVTDEEAWAVGAFAEVWQRTDGQWHRREDAPKSQQDYHSVYVDPDGGVWAVGGDIIAEPLRSGVLAYFGTAEVEGGWSE